MDTTNAGALVTPTSGFQHFFKTVPYTVLPIAGATIAMPLIQSVLHEIWEFLQRLFCTTISVESGDEAFNWLLEWLHEHPYTSRASLLIASSQEGGPRTRARVAPKRPSIYFFPALGSHWFFYERTFVWLRRSRIGGFAKPVMSRKSPMESISLTFFGWNRDKAKKVFFDAMNISLARDEKCTTVYMNDAYGNWAPSKVGVVRSLDSVILQKELKDKIVNDVKRFATSEQWYLARGIPYRRGYLLHGIPGSGKTSFITALAGELRINIYAINLASPSLTDDMLFELMSSTASSCILLLEDIDAALEDFTSKGTNDTQTQVRSSRVSFSGLLNALDGVAAQEGRIVFMTTNHPERLNPALIRPGRVDVQAHFGHATAKQIRKMLRIFYTDEAPLQPVQEITTTNEDTSVSEKSSSTSVRQKLQMNEDIINRVAESKISMAQLQGFLLQHKDSIDDALNHIEELIQKEKVNDDTPSDGQLRVGADSSDEDKSSL